MDKVVLQSPAKINIGLNILNKREDGFHNLQTIFYPLLLSDTLYFEKSEEININTNSNELAGLDSNLILDAKQLIEDYKGQEFQTKIFLDKKIPIGAGLGGGSSNAAATLKGLNSLYGLGISYSTIFAMALDLGSDVPFFLNPIPSFATSRGEKLRPVNFSISYPLLLINPGIHISTKWAFSNIDIKNANTRLSNLAEAGKFDFNELKNIAVNDFEVIVFKKYEQVEHIKVKLLSFGADYASMTGTGSSVYGIFSNMQNARRAEEYFRERYFTFLNYPVNKGSIT